MTGTQEIAPAAEKRGGAGTFLMIALISILALLLVFPGFLAGMLSKADKVYLLDESGWMYPPDRTLTPVLEVILYPASKMMEGSTMICKFYVWQYKLTGGDEAYTDSVPPVLPPVSNPNPLEK